MKAIPPILLISLVVLTAAPSPAASVSWSGDGDGTSWGDPFNWSSGTVPSANDDVLINAGGNLTVVLRGSQSVQSLENHNTLWIQGGNAGSHALLTSANGVTNHGTLRLESVDGGYSETLTISAGYLVNAADGVVQINPGSGGSRTVNGSIVNQGVLNVASGISLSANSGGGTFLQQAGTINGQGWFAWAGGQFTFSGGAVTGVVYVVNATLDVGAGASPSTLYASGNCTLLANRSPQVTVWVQGNNPYSHASLTTAAGAFNAGILHFESADGGYNSFLYTASSGLTNLASGVLQFGSGSGGPRLISGYLMNQGLVDAAAYYVDVYGTYQEAGGLVLDNCRFNNIALLETASPPQPMQLDLWGLQTTLLTDNLTNVVLWVHGNGGGGHAALTAAGFTNYGMLRLESSDGGYIDTISVTNGMLVNAVDGLIQVNPGSGGPRNLDASVLNQGTINVGSGISLSLDSSGGTFQQQAGTINASGGFIWSGGQFTFSGGDLIGAVYVVNAILDVGAGASPSTLYASGNCTLLANRSPQVTVWVQGNNAYGHTYLTTAAGAVNAGTLHFESANAGYNSSLYTASSGLTNLTSGVLQFANGSGGPRFISGYLINEGLIDASAYYVEVDGTYQEAGGLVLGGCRFINITLLETSAPPQPTQLDLWGSQTTLLTDNLTNVVLWVHGDNGGGPATLTAARFTNHGTLRLESSDQGFNDTISVTNGMLVNAADGLIQVNTGSGGPRNLNASVLNQGTINVASGISLALDSSGGTFLQQAGTINAQGRFAWFGGQFTFSGGAIAGAVYVVNANLDVEAGAAASTIYASANCTLLANRSPQVTVWVQGNNAYGHTYLTTAPGAVNAGILHFESTDQGFNSALYTASSGLTNLTSGVLQFASGSGGPRFISGYLINEGLIDASAYYVEVDGTYQEAGGLVLGGCRFINITLLETSAPPQPTQLDLWGSQTTLLTDNLTNVVLWVHGDNGGGPATLTAARFTNHGTLRLESSDQGFNDTISVTNGMLVNAADGLIQVNPGSGGQRNLNAAFANAGTITINSSLSLGQAGAQHVNTGLINVLNSTATLTGSSFTNQGPGVITGTGMLDVSGLNFQNAATIRPGAAPGILTLSGTYNQTASGRLAIEIGGLNPGSDYDQLAVTGPANLNGGDLAVSFLNDFLPSVSNTFTVLTAASVSGQFDAYDNLNFSLDRALVPFYAANSVSLDTVATNSPVSPPVIVNQPADLTVPYGQSATFRVSANGTRPFVYQWQFNAANLQAQTNATLVINPASTNDAGLYSVIISNSAGSVTSLVARLTVLTIADLVITDITNPTNAIAGQPITLTWVSLNRGSQAAFGPWKEAVALSTNSSGVPASPLAVFVFPDTLGPGQSISRTQAVILPGGLEGQYYPVLTIDVDYQVYETNRSDSTTVSLIPVQVHSPDAVPANLALSTGSVQLGQSLNVTWAVTNAGLAPILAPWTDRLYLGTQSTSLSGALLLASVAETGVPLAPGGGISNQATVLIPLSSQVNAGSYFILLDVNADNAILESNSTNNLASAPLTLLAPPLPTLVASPPAYPATAAPGQSIMVSWGGTNLGAAAAPGPWRETLWLVPGTVTPGQFASNPAAYTLLGSFTYTNGLATNASVTRAEQVTVPIHGVAGDQLVGVWVDSDRVVVEQDRTGNTALGANVLQVPLTLSLNLPLTNVPENTLEPNLPCLVWRNGDLSAPLTITLTSDASQQLTVPASVTIPAGAPSAPFTATVHDDGVVGSDTLVTIMAQAGSYSSATAQILIAETDQPHLSLSLAVPQVLAGQPLAATVSSDTVSPKPVSITIASSSPTALSAPALVTVPANASSVAFTLLAAGTTAIEPPHTYTVTASAAGYAGAATNVTVVNNNTPALFLTLDRTNISEADGPLAAVGTVTRVPVTDQPVTVALASSNAAAATVPAQVIIPGLQGQATFNIAAVRDNAVTGPKLTEVSAQVLDTFANPTGGVATQALAVQDADGPALTVTLAERIVPKGANPATTAMVTRNTPPTNSLVVALTSSDPNEATVPANVTMLAGHMNVSLAIATLNDGISNSTHAVLITAAATNHASASDQLLVSDLALPDLVISSVTAPASGFIGEPLPLGYRMLNQGLGPLTNGVIQNVYLTTNPASGNPLLGGSITFNGTLPAGQYVDQALVVPGGAVLSPGTYWVVVTADAGFDALELNKANNTTVSLTPIVLFAEYTATVQAGVTNVVAGTPVPLTGSATLVGGGPAANKPVNLTVNVRGLQRVFGVFTDANGNFSTVFTPLPTEGGYYSVSAAEPGVTDTPPQAYFAILGMASSPTALSLSVVEGSKVSGSVNVANLSEVPLTGLTANIVGLVANLSASVTPGASSLAGQGTVALSYVVSASDASISRSSFTVHLASAEGVALDLPVAVAVQPLLPRLAAAPSQLAATMLRGSQVIVQFDVLNLGGAASGPLTVNVPAVPWLSVASTNPLPSLSPGNSNLVTLVLTPAADLALGPYAGTLTVNGSGAGLLVPFTFTAVSDAHGALRVHSTDEYTYFAPGNPPLTNASISIIEPFSGATLATGFTDTNGVFFASNLTEGTYELDLAADSHTPFRGSAVVTAGATNDVEAFLSRQTVHYTWTVVPTNVQDVTLITIQAEFEANVPAPVVVPSPTSIDLASLRQPGQFMDVPLTLANYGLIAVQGVTINISDHPLYSFDLLTRNIGTLPAHGTVTVPMRITRLAASMLEPKAAEPCDISFSIGYFYLCGVHDVGTGIPIPVLNVTGDCPPAQGGPGTIVVVGCNGCGGGGTFVIPPGTAATNTCDQCMAKAILECAIGFTPAGCPYGIWNCAANAYAQGWNESTVENCVQQGIGCIPGWGNPVSCLWSFLRCKCPGALSNVPSCIAQALDGGAGGSVAGAIQPYKDLSVGVGLSALDPRDVYVARSYPLLQFIQMVVGDTDGRWFSSGSGSAFGAWFYGFGQAIQSSSDAGALISSNELATLSALPRPDTVSLADVQAVADRWNLTLTSWRAGVLSLTNVPPGGNTNFIDFFALANLMNTVAQQYQLSQAAGYDSPVAGFFAALQQAESRLTGGGVCAHVVLQLDQQAVLTRDAFRATLQLDNQSGDPLMNVSVNLVVRNQTGQDVTSVFGILPPTLAGALTGVDGSGLLPPNASGSAQWTLIPTLDAAPQVQTNYLVSGAFSYLQNGVTVTIPLAPSPISVQPSPQLYVKYFHQRDVFADDPTTPQIEPSIPYSLGVLVQNQGYGVAHDFRITSAQPKIVDNEKGLLINFQIIGAQVGTQPVAPSLTVDFGDLAPGQVQEGRWLLTSSLQGLFVDYSATFQHVDSLGNPRLSLIEGVEIHEMIHLVQAPGAWDDGLADFLVDDLPSFDHLPDTLYLSDGSKQPVSAIQTAAADAPAATDHLQVQLTANFPAGFTYLLVPDPGNGQFTLASVLAAGGPNLNANNYYTTDRTFIGLGQPPVHENKLHLFDYHANAGLYTYTLVYAAPSTTPQTNPPVSAVFALPAHSPSIFGVVWSGASYVGQAPIAYFDVYVSDNGAPFTVWQTHTLQTGALFNGVLGHSYAFYSVATDSAGNVQAPPATPDALTVADITNTPPVIAFPTNLVVLNEGDALQLAPAVNDPDLPPQTLTFTLLAGAPPGVTVDPAAGQLNWPTPKGSGGTTNHLGVIVTDDGFPPLSATGLVSVVIQSLNSPPILAPISNYIINEGFRLVITNLATDYDLPPQTFTWTLGSGAPDGASINPTNGIFAWQPVVRQGPSTNVLTVTVTDSGVPPLSATQQFTVIVRHTLPDMVVTLGRTNVLTGQPGAVPVTLASTLGLTNLTFQLGAPASQLTGFMLNPLVAEVTSASLQPLDSNNYAASFVLNPALQLGETRSLASLSFMSLSNLHSAIVPLSLSALAGLQDNGQAVLNPTGSGGQVIVIGAEPVLELVPGGILSLYGRPGAPYTLQTATSLGPLPPWSNLFSLTLTNSPERFNWTDQGDAFRLFRVSSP